MGLTYFLLDHRLIERTENAVLRLGNVRKDPAGALMAADKPWEAWYDNLYGNLLYDHDEKLYKLWHSPFLYHKFVPGRKRSTKENESGVCYATSSDGISWQKPELNLIDFEGSRANNLVMRNVHGVGVMKDPHDSEASRRYKMFFKDQRTPANKAGNGFRLNAGVAFSPDGIHWTRDDDIVLPRWFGHWGDTHNNVFRNEESGKYVIITRTWTDPEQGPDFWELPAAERQGKAIGAVRLVARMESADFRVWSRPVDISLTVPGEWGRRQPYTMPSYRWEGIYLGLLMMFNTVEGDWTVDCELTWSPDTWHWYRVCPGQSLIPRGAEGSHDFGTVYAAHGPVKTQDGIRLYYGGFEKPHDGYRKGSLCLAHLRHDGWAGFEPESKDQTAEILTAPIEWGEGNLWLSADAEGGQIQVATANGAITSLPITGNITREPLRWQNDAESKNLGGKKVRLHFNIRKAKLYAFGFR